MRFGILAPMPSELRPVITAFGRREGRSGDLEGHVGTAGGNDVVATTTATAAAAAAPTAAKAVAGTVSRSDG
jgi:hypothetical protein